MYRGFALLDHSLLLEPSSSARIKSRNHFSFLFFFFPFQDDTLINVCIYLILTIGFRRPSKLKQYRFLTVYWSKNSTQLANGPQYPRGNGPKEELYMAAF